MCYFIAYKIKCCVIDWYFCIYTSNNIREENRGCSLVQVILYNIEYKYNICSDPYWFIVLGDWQ